MQNKCGLMILTLSSMTFAKPSAAKRVVAVASSTVVEGYTLTARPFKKKYGADEPIVLVVTLKNVGRNNAEIVSQDALVTYTIHISLPAKKKLPFTLYGQEQLGGPGPRESAYRSIKILKPNEATQVGFVLNRLYDMSLRGTYRATVSTQVWRRNKPDQFVTLKSNIANIVVVDTSPVIDVKQPK